MNLIAFAPIWLIVVLAAALAAAAAEDVARLRISNVTCLIVLVGAIVAMALVGFPAALWQNLVLFLALLGVGTLAFGTGQVGGGDVKLLACLGLWVSLGAGLWLIASIFIAGGVIALVYLLVGTVRRANRGPGDKPLRKTKVPYGLAIVAGAALIFAGQLGLLTSKHERTNPFSVKLG